MKHPIIVRPVHNRSSRRGRAQFETLLIVGVVAVGGIVSFSALGDSTHATIGGRTLGQATVAQIGSSQQAAGASVWARLGAMRPIPTDYKGSSPWFKALKDEVLPAIRENGYDFDRTVAQLVDAAPGNRPQASALARVLGDIAEDLGPDGMQRTSDFGQPWRWVGPESEIIYAAELYTRKLTPNDRSAVQYYKDAVDRAQTSIEGADAISSQTKARIMAFREIFGPKPIGAQRQKELSELFAAPQPTTTRVDPRHSATLLHWMRPIPTDYKGSSPWFKALKDEVLPAIRENGYDFDRTVAQLVDAAPGSRPQASALARVLGDIAEDLGPDGMQRTSDFGQPWRWVGPESEIIYAAELYTRKLTPNDRSAVQYYKDAVDRAQTSIEGADAISSQTKARIMAFREIFGPKPPSAERTKELYELFASEILTSPAK